MGKVQAYQSTDLVGFADHRRDIVEGPAVVLNGSQQDYRYLVDEETLEKELDRLQFMRVDGKYDYLLSIQVRSMTAKRLADLQHELEQLRKAIKTLEKIDLDTLKQYATKDSLL
jgi:hypothetical protein